MNRQLLLALALFVQAPVAAWGAVIRVPEDVSTVVAAVDSAAVGDTVSVAPGTWTDKDTRVIWTAGQPFTVTACAFPKSGVTLLGRDGAAVTALDLQGEGEGLLRVVMVANQNSGAVAVEGLTLTGARGPTGGKGIVGVLSEKLTVRSCRLVENDDGDSDGAGVAVRDCELELVDSEISRNTSGSGAVWGFDSDVMIEGCLFEDNVGRAIWLDGELGNVSIMRSSFIGNRGAIGAPAVGLSCLSDFVVRECLFLRNTAELYSGGGLYVQESSGTVEFCTFAYDSCLGNGVGAGLRWDQSEGTVQNNTFVGCYSPVSGASFSAVDGRVTFTENIVAHSAGLVAVTGARTTVSGGCSDYWANEMGNYTAWPLLPTDIFVDPLFCDLESLDLTLRENSPCADGNTPGCGQIGAFGVGCDPVAFAPLSWGRIKQLYR
jgi:hypothetical protein